MDFRVYDQLESLEAVLTHVERGIEDLSDPIEESMDLVHRDIVINFEEEGVYTLDGGWAPLNKNYEIWKINLVGDRQKLILQNFEIDQAVHSPDITVNEDEGVLEINSELAAIHHSGAQIDSRREIPARPIVAIAATTAQEIEGIFADFIDDLFEWHEVSGYSYERNGKTVRVPGYRRRGGLK